MRAMNNWIDALFNLALDLWHIKRNSHVQKSTVIDQTKFIITPRCLQPTLHTCIVYQHTTCSQLPSAMILFAAKSEKIFHDAIMLLILIKINLYWLKVALIFFVWNIAVAVCWLFYNCNKKTCSSCIVKLYKHAGTFENTWEVWEALAYGSCFFKHCSYVLKVLMCLYKSTMHSAHFLIL